MKKIFILLFLLLATRALAVTPVAFREGVSFSTKITGTGTTTMTVYGESTVAIPTTTAGESATSIVELRPGRTYPVNFSGNGPNAYAMSFTAPDGYVVYLNSLPSDLYGRSGLSGSYSHDYTLEIRPPANSSGANWGSFSGMALGKSVTWEVGLGTLRTGRGAGSIIFKEADIAANAAIRDLLYYTAPQNVGQIVVKKDGASNQTLRQIRTPQGYTDLVDVSGGGGYEIKFYELGQMTGTNGPLWTFSGTPWKTIKVENPSAKVLKITEKTEGTGSPVIRVSTLTQTGHVLPPGATGGTITTNGGNTIHTFTSTGTFTLNGGISSVDYLVVGGGGGGGNTYGGGGGAGDVKTGSVSVSNIAYPVVVGSGGSSGASGSASSFNSISASGGGAGGSAAAGSSGGSGGGGGPNAVGGAAGSGSNVYPGGGGDNGGHGGTSGGGGGAGAAGGGLATGTFQGGIGITSSITGTPTYYGGGGGGAPIGTGAMTSGGWGGGGNGNWQFGYAGSANTGGGGGGGANGYNGGVGGSGVVIVRYVTPLGDAGNFTWTLEEGDASTVVRTTTHTSSVVTGGRQVIVEVSPRTTAGTVAVRTKYNYVTKAWGEELGSIVADPTGSTPGERTTTYDYYSTPPTSGDEHRGNYRRLKSIIYPTGNWVAWHYFNDWDQRGQLHHEFHPYLAAPTSPPSIDTDSDVTAALAVTNNGRVVTLAYTYDWTGRWREVSSRIEKINNVKTAQTTRDQDYDSSPTLPRMRYNENGYYDNTYLLATHVEYYRADAGDPDLVGQLLVTTSPNAVQTSRSVCRGIYYPSTNSFSMTGAGDYWREITFHGQTTNDATWGTPDSVTSYDGQLCDAINMVRNKSTVDVAVRLGNGAIIRTDTLVYTGGSPNAFSLLRSEVFTYDNYGHLMSRTDSNGAVTSYDWDNGQLQGTKSPDGIETRFTYDKVGRMKTSTKKGASTGVTNDITTTYTYDGADHVLQTETAGSGLSLAASATYDPSGRLETSVAPGNSGSGYTTSYAYASGGKLVTVTLPGGATQRDEIYPDGQIKIQDGTARIKQEFSYSVNGSTGNITRQVNFGGSSTALVKTTADWLNRPITETKPGWNGTDVSRTWTYNSGGQVAKLTQPGVAPTGYVYDFLGNLVREYLDLNGNNVADLTTDRVTDRRQSFFPSGGGWSSRETVSTYAGVSSATATQIAKVETQVSGFPSNRMSRADSFDIYGNVTTTTVDIDRTAKKVTTTTDVPDSATTDAVQIAYNGLVTSAQDQAGNITTYGYDPLARPITSTDPRTGTTTTAYISGSSQILTVKDPLNVTQATYQYDNAGRVYSVTDALSKTAYTSYTLRNEVKQQWGHTMVPVEYSYDDLGHKTLMTTYRGGSGWSSSVWPSTTLGTADFTAWVYDGSTGLLKEKYDAANLNGSGSPISGATKVAYTYTQSGQIKTRAWQRGVTTTYYYFGEGSGEPLTGELRKVDYSDATTDLEYTYNRLGNVATVTDMTGTRTFNYSSGTLELQSEDLPSFYLSKRITYPHATTGVVGRPTGIQLGTSGSPSASQSVVYDYDGFGRFKSLAGGGQTFSYGYELHSNLVKTIDNTAANYTDTRTYDSKHDWVDNRQTKIGSAIKAEFAYVQDNLGRITSVAKTEELFNVYGNSTQGLVTAYDYTDRSEVKSEITKLGGTTTVLSGRDDAYQYDTMGNRASSAGTTHKVPIGGTSTALTADYTTNKLNQYTARTRTVPGYFDVAGAETPATIKVGPPGVPTDIATRHGLYFFDAYPLGSTSAAAYSELEITDGANPTPPLAKLKAFVAATSETLLHDLDGNLTRDGRWNYYYDAENRLAWIETTAAASSAGAPVEAWSFYYDYLGRRAWKHKYVWDSGAWKNASPLEQTRFIYDGWNVIAESDGSTITKNYYWGMDIAGPGQRAGGVGGLLMMQDSTGSFLPAYDGNGNVHGLITTASVTFGGTTYAAGSLVAAYEYDAFGKTLREVGPYAAKNAFRFSTKYADLETGLVYYGLRFYSPTMGRFINKDPIEERGGLNLYGFCGNNGVNSWDYLGMWLHNSDPVIEAQVTEFLGQMAGGPYASQYVGVPSALGLATADSLMFSGFSPSNATSYMGQYLDAKGNLSWTNPNDAGSGAVGLVDQINGYVAPPAFQGTPGRTGTDSEDATKLETFRVGARDTVDVNAWANRFSAPQTVNSTQVSAGGDASYSDLMRDFVSGFTPINATVPISRSDFLNILKTEPDAKAALEATAAAQIRRNGGDTFRRESGFIIARNPVTGAIVIGPVYFGREYKVDPSSNAPIAHLDFRTGISWAQKNGYDVLGGVHSHPNDRPLFVSNADRAVHDFNNFWGVVLFQGTTGNRGTVVDPNDGKTKGERFW